jgi:predicted ATPase
MCGPGLDLARHTPSAGPGGVGKTRLAIEAARRCVEHYGEDSVAVTYLAAVGKADALDREVLAALRITNQGNAPAVDVLVEHLRDRGPTLLVLDNCERLWDDVAELVATLIAEVPHLRVLAISRRYLEVSGDQRLDGGRLPTAREPRKVRSHQRTLQEVFDWSYELCSPGEQRLWARVSVFAGGFDLDSAEEVCAGPGRRRRRDRPADVRKRALVAAWVIEHRVVDHRALDASTARAGPTAAAPRW